MNRLEFLTRMRVRLEQGGLAGGEIEEAMRYYEELFLDAGSSRETETAQQLGDPEKLAEEILEENGLGKGGFDIPDVQTGGEIPYTEPHIPSQTTRVPLWCKILILVLTFPLWVGLVGGAFGILVGIICGLFGLVTGLTFGSIGALISGVIQLFIVPPSGVCSIGAGLAGLGLFGVAVVPLLNLSVRGIKALFKKIGQLFKRIFAGGAR